MKFFGPLLLMILFTLAVYPIAKRLWPATFCIAALYMFVGVIGLFLGTWIWN